MRLMNQRDRRTEAEYNLEFRGSVRDLQKRALFMKFYPEICLEITQKCIKITLLLAKWAVFVKCYKGQHWSTGC